MKRGDRVATAIHARRTGRGMTMRDVEAATQALAQRDPETYDVVSRGTVSNLENEGAAYFGRLTRPMTPAKMTSLIEVLFDGDADLWVSETGVQVSAPTESADLLRPRPLYVEGGPATATHLQMGQAALREQVPALPWADLLLEITGEDNVPVVWPGQVVGVTLSSLPVTRGLNVLILRGQLRLAWQVSPGRYAFTTGDRPAFGLGPRDAVVGHVRWVTPQLPAEPVRQAG